MSDGLSTKSNELKALAGLFLKLGTTAFGGPAAHIAMMEDEVVRRRQWLGQFTPGPLFATATFIGYLLSGPTGAVVATVGIFLPAFIFIALSAPIIPKLRASPAAGALLDGVNVASLALMAAVTWRLGAAALVDWLTVALAATSALLLLRWRINSAWLVLGGAAVGLTKHLLH